MTTNLLEVLGAKFPDSSNNFLRDLLKHRRVLVGGVLATHNLKITLDQEVTVLPKRRLVEGVTALYVDDHLVVVEKPEGLLSVATDFETKKTLHAMLKKSYPTVWPVHRLDRETSGVMVFGLSYAAKEGLKQQFMEHAIYREYQALVDGAFSGKGSWKHEIYEDASYFMRVVSSNNQKPAQAQVALMPKRHFNARKGGKPQIINEQDFDLHIKSCPKDSELAITHYEALEQKKWSTRVKFVLETGKKNQIRVQAAHEGHPIVGDKKYGSKNMFLKRLALHAHRLEFTHPITNKRLTFTSPTPF